MGEEGQVISCHSLAAWTEQLHKCNDSKILGSVRSWFRKLPPGTIDSFDDLSRLFIANFMSYQWFNQPVLEVEDPSDKVVVMAIMEVLRLGPLFDSLLKNVSKILSTLQSKADKYIVAEELAEVNEGGEEEVDAMPTFVFLKEGKLVDRVVGAKKDELQQAIAEHMNSS
ncbi:thioredoxin H1-like [Actinidia eriantha]|uniref:thioredoxin H1-like n=1 Tax=Actinidia eriantha TaxID=165200 RepID=UPI002587382F|nr:thioredoxin H1-like [Actinidia eriantha]